MDSTTRPFGTDSLFVPTGKPATRHGSDPPVTPKRANPPAAKDLEKKAPEVQSPPKPDASLLSAGRLVIGLVHGLILLGIAGLLLWYLLTLPALLGRKNEAVATIVAPGLTELRAPVDGVFVSAAHMPNGTRVRKGQLLGHVSSPQLESDIRTAQDKLETLHRRKLLLQHQGAERDAHNLRLELTFPMARGHRVKVLNYEIP